ncbi:CbtB domain-containing protein [Paroceanicella profunda]|nr:CbtB domain-containing protein [Paroceanicella profunda]
MTTTMTTAAPTAHTPSRRETTGLAGIVSALVIGAGLVFFAGFAHSQTLHDAAHDTRHVTGFPCH